MGNYILGSELKLQYSFLHVFTCSFISSIPYNFLYSFLDSFLYNFPRGVHPNLFIRIRCANTLINEKTEYESKCGILTGNRKVILIHKVQLNFVNLLLFFMFKSVVI